MQTFLLDKDFRKTAELLDQRRLGKQRVETMQILSVLTGLKWDNNMAAINEVTSKAWSNHPAVRMWRGYERALLRYQYEVCGYWMELGFKDSCLWKSEKIFDASNASRELIIPDWLTVELVNSHKSALLYKDEEFYKKYDWDVPREYNYIWPVV